VRGEKFSYADEAFAFIEELDRLTAPDAAMDAMQKSLSLFGFDNFIMTCLPGPREKFEQAVLMRKWPKGWFELYASQDYVRVDPVIHHCRNTVQPFEWKDAPIHENAGPRALEVMNRAVDYGMKEGFCLPVHGINGYEACLSMSGKALDISSRTKPALHLMSMYAFERIRTHVSRASDPPAKTLTSREREMLVWAAAGKSAADTGDIVGITERTVTAHIVSACQKLQATNKTQAVARALQYRIITI
jgi:LuxR family transcriptional regulator, quorum-sensing system regulator BjaR1